MTHPQIPDEAVNAATGVYGGPDGRMRAALAAALPHLRVQETPACGERCYSMTESGAGYVDPDCPKHAAPHPRPVVDREALEQLLIDHAVGRHVPKDASVYRAEIAAAVLALVPTIAADSDLNEHLTGRTWPDLQHHLIHDHGLSAAFVSHKNGPWASIHEDAHTADDPAETDGR